MQQLIFGPALFYDLPEYLNIVSNNSFFQVFSMGHFPIHPIFMGILWILIKFLPVNAIAMLFGTASIFIFYKISKNWLPTIVFLLFPVVWLINTNLMVESMTLTFYLSSLYFFLSGKRNWFFISVFLMIGTHLESIFWIPTFFLFKFRYIKTSLFAIAVSIVFYALIYFFSGRAIAGTTEQITTYFSSGLLRMIRNSWLSFIRDFGSLTPFVFLILLYKNIKSEKELIKWGLFLFLVGSIGANWQGDFMGRRIIFAAPILALVFYKYLGKKTIFIILYLLPIVVANVILYSKGSPFFKLDIPKDQVLIQTHYLKPFTKYDGTILWIGEDDLGVIDEYLDDGKRVFLAKEAVTAPYLLLVGQNYHITSVGKVGEPESGFLFKKYSFEQNGNVLELKALKSDRAVATRLIYYDQSFWGRLVRRRIDYGDIGTWIWVLITNHRDPMDWTYIDTEKEGT